jgi:hypothetical protein
MTTSRFTAFFAVGVLFFVAAASSASASCPNAVFRSGPSAKLPDCRAYELVTPPYTGGVSPGYISFLADLEGMFATDTVTPQGDSVVYQTVGGALGGYPGTGYVDRYRAKRTSGGWVTGAISPGGTMSSGGGPGGISADHEYTVERVGAPTDEVWPGLGGHNFVDVIRTPNGYEPVGLGSLGFADEAQARWVTAGGDHLIFTTSTRIEPVAALSGATVYDRTPGGPTQVVSLLPGGEAAAQAHFLGATNDGSEVAFNTAGGSLSGDFPIYVRRNNAVTKEVVRPGGVAVGKELKCTGKPEGATLSYQWLRNGAPIGVTSPTYTIAGADEGAVVQCQVTATNSEGTSIGTSATRVVEPYQGKSFPTQAAASVSPSGESVSVGTPLSCGAGSTGGFTVQYQWLREGSTIGGATSSTYTPVGGDAGGSLQCRVKVSNSEGASVGFSSPVSVYEAAPLASAGPAISNETSPGNSTPAVGGELSCSPGTWSASPTFAYQWLRSGGEISGATTATYTVTVADEGKPLQCQVTATNASGSTQAASDRLVVDPQPGTAPPQQSAPGSVIGNARVGAKLTCQAGTWSGSPSVVYQWLRNGEEIASATASTYTVTVADVGTVIECRVTATNTGGRVVALDAGNGAKVATPTVSAAEAILPQPGFTFGGIFNGRVFYSDADTNQAFEWTANPGDLYIYDLDEEKTIRITDTGDAILVNVSEDGSHAYFVSRSPIGGEGEAGEPNLGVYSVADGSSKFIATLAEKDVTRKEAGYNQFPSLATWSESLVNPSFDHGAAMVHDRSTPDGAVFAFESTAQLTGFDNTEASAEDCGGAEDEKVPVPGQACDEVYRYDTVTEELECISCGPGSGPARGNGRLQTVGHASGLGTIEVEPATVNVPIESLSPDGDTIFFESTEGLVPQDGNGTKDVYRWKKGVGVALISTGQDVGESALYAVTPDGSDVIFATREKLLPQDENGTTVRFYDARVDGGFPPSDESVTEPCAVDACQGAARGAPDAPQVASHSVEGGGNVSRTLRCGKGRRKVVRRGAERCIKSHHHRRASSKRRAAR